MRLLLAMLALAGACATPSSLDKEALAHERRAERLGQLGQPEQAARERHRAENLRASARLQIESQRQHFNWVGM